MSDLIIEAFQQLGWKVFLHEIQQRSDTNVSLSPVNLLTALLILHSGTSNDTILKVCQLTGIRDEEIHEYMHMFIRLLMNKNSMKASNSLFFKEKEMNLNPVFRNIVRDYYQADVIGEMNFLEKPQQCVETINQWISNHTDGFSQDDVLRSISPLAELILVSTLYFKSDWEKPFDQNKSYVDDFLLEESKTRVQNKFMSQTDEFDYFSNEYCQVLELPYQDEDTYSMVFLLPHKDLDSLQNVLSPEFFNNSYERLSMEKVHVSLPVFKVSYASDLTDYFEQLGMDFKNMNRIFKSTSPFLESFKQKTMIDVNEKGSEIASSAVVSLGANTPALIEFNANHPFMYVIVEKISRISVFIGCVRNPVESIASDV